MWIFQEFAVICWYYFLFVRSHIFLPDTTMSGFFCPFFNVKLILAFSFLPISTAKTDMSVSEVPIPKNVILALARGSHLRRVFPVPRDYRWQSNTVPITGSEVQPKEGFHYAKQWQSEDLLYLRSQHRRKGTGHQGTARLLLYGSRPHSPQGAGPRQVHVPISLHMEMRWRLPWLWISRCWRHHLSRLTSLRWQWHPRRLYARP